MKKNETIDLYFNTGRKFIKETYNKNNSFGEINTIIRRGIVIEINDKISDENSAYIIPFGSLRIKLLGESVETKNINGRWYAPLLPIHMLILPELGEEILILMENQDPGSNGFWIGRVNDTNKLNKNYARSQFDEQNPIDRYGLNFLVENEFGENLSDSINSIPIKTGDTLIQNRKKSFIRMSSYNDLYSILEIGLRKNNLPNSLTSDVIQHYSSKILQVENSSLRDFIDEKVLSGVTGNIDNASSLTLLYSDKIINRTDEKKELHHAVLGNVAKKILHDIKELFNDQISNNKKLLQLIKNFSVTNEEMNLRQNVSIPFGEEDVSFVINITIPQHESKISEESLKMIKENIESYNLDMEDKIDAINENIENTLSNNQFLD